MFPHSTSVEVLPSQEFHSMGLTTNAVALSSDGAVVSVDEEELPQAVMVRARVTTVARGRNVIEPAYESPCVQSLQP